MACLTTQCNIITTQQNMGLSQQPDWGGIEERFFSNSWSSSMDKTSLSDGRSLGPRTARICFALSPACIITTASHYAAQRLNPQQHRHNLWSCSTNVSLGSWESDVFSGVELDAGPASFQWALECLESGTSPSDCGALQRRVPEAEQLFSTTTRSSLSEAQNGLHLAPL